MKTRNLNWQWIQAKSFLGNRTRRRVPGIRSTEFRLDPIDQAVRLYYHSTPVISWYPDGRIVLNSGGRQTLTTRTRINQYTPAGVYQRAFQWYLSNPFNPQGKQDQPFFDGITVYANGWTSPDNAADRVVAAADRG